MKRLSRLRAATVPSEDGTTCCFQFVWKSPEVGADMLAVFETNKILLFLLYNETDTAILLKWLHASYWCRHRTLGSWKDWTASIAHYRKITETKSRKRYQIANEFKIKLKTKAKITKVRNNFKIDEMSIKNGNTFNIGYRKYSNINCNFGFPSPMLFINARERHWILNISVVTTRGLESRRPNEPTSNIVSCRFD